METILGVRKVELVLVAVSPCGGVGDIRLGGLKMVIELRPPGLGHSPHSTPVPFSQTTSHFLPPPI